MNLIGMTMKYGLFLPSADNAGNEAHLKAYGTVEHLMARYRELGVESIELSAVHTHMCLPEIRQICQRIMGAGLHLTLHGTLEDMPACEQLDFFSPLYEDIFRRQSDLSITLHAFSDLDRTIAVTADWCAEAEKRFPQLTYLIENQRVRLPGSAPHFKINAIPPTLPTTQNVGICWDMGHYAYNTIKDGFPAETVPAPDTLKRIRHTHIHGIHNMETHFPVADDEPVATYVNALRASGYEGIYNLELVPGRFMKDFPDVRGAIESSILRLKEMIHP